MIRSARLRAAILCAALYGLSPSAEAKQSAPPGPAAQVSAQPAGKARASKQTPAGPQGSPPAEAIDSQRTPAQVLYGMPRNPIVGERVRIDLSRPLTLERAIQYGLQQQNSIAIAATQIQSANSRLVEARSSYYPQVTPSLQYDTNLSPGSGRFGSRSGGAGTVESRTDGIVARQTIWDTGRREASVGQSRRSVFAAEYNLGNQRQNVVLNVTESWYNLLRDRELVRVQEESVKRAQTTLDSIRAQVEVGNAAKSDTLQAEADLANAQVALLNAQVNYSLAQSSLKNAMGVVSDQRIQIADEKTVVPSLTQDSTPVGQYIRSSYLNRLDLKQQQERINAQGYALRIARINSGLTVDATISEGYQLDPDAGEQRLFSVNFSYPLFDAGRTRAAVKDSQALLEQERRTLDTLQQTARLNIEQSFDTRETSRRRIAAAQTAVEAGRSNYNAALEKQRNGVVNILDVINAEVQLINAEVALVQAIYDFYIADARLQRDIGANDPAYTPRVPAARPVRQERSARIGAIPAPAAGGPGSHDRAVRTPERSSQKGAQSIETQSIETGSKP